MLRALTACEQQESNQPDVHQPERDDARAIKQFDYHGTVLSLDAN